MKKSVILITLFLAACAQENKEYKTGDIIYLKPDSVKALIIDDNVMFDDYEIKTSEHGLAREYCSESEIYGKEQKAGSFIIQQP